MPVITTVTLTIPAKNAARASDVSERIASLLGELKEQAALSGVAVKWSPLEKEREVTASDKSALAAAAYLMQFVGPISPATIWTLCNEKPDAVGKVQAASPTAYLSADDWQREFGFNWPIQPQQAFERLEKVGLMERLGRGQPPVWPAQTSQRGAWGVLYCLTAEGHAWFEREGLGRLKPEFIAQLAEVGQALQPYRDKKGRVQQFISREDVPEPPKPVRVGRSGRVGRGEGRSSRSNATTEASKNVEKW